MGTPANEQPRSKPMNDHVVVTVAGRHFTVRRDTADRIQKLIDEEPLPWVHGGPGWNWFAPGVDEDSYRIWKLSGADCEWEDGFCFELWWWDGPDGGGMGADMRSADNAYNLGSFHSLHEAKKTAHRHFKERVELRGTPPA